MSDLPDNRSMKMQFSVPADKVDEMTNAWGAWQGSERNYQK